MSDANRQPGFSLLELLVVIAIIGLLSGAVLLAMDDPRGRLVDDAERFSERIRLARDRAVTLARPVAVRVSAQGYAFDERRAGGWQLLEERPLNRRSWRAGVTARSAPGAATRLWFDATGRADQPLDFRLERGPERIDVHVGLDGRVRTRG